MPEGASSSWTMRKRFAGCVWRITSLYEIVNELLEDFHATRSSRRTYEHLLILGNCDTLALNHMDIFQSTQYITVHLKDDLGEELGSLLDCEWFVLESLKGVGTSQVEGDIGLSGCLNGE
ncbi:hypothetical protein TMatcc_003219 [Talaromyces marneffei ATCC 18224]